MFTHGELMVDFVDVFVDPAMMQQPMQKVVPGVFYHSAAKTLSQNIRPEEGDQRRESPPSIVLDPQEHDCDSRRVHQQMGNKMGEIAPTCLEGPVDVLYIYR